jgi:hypothetical protein
VRIPDLGGIPSVIVGGPKVRIISREEIISEGKWHTGAGLLVGVNRVISPFTEGQDSPPFPPIPSPGICWTDVMFGVGNPVVAIHFGTIFRAEGNHWQAADHEKPMGYA